MKFTSLQERVFAYLWLLPKIFHPDNVSYIKARHLKQIDDNNWLTDIQWYSGAWYMVLLSQKQRTPQRIFQEPVLQNIIILGFLMADTSLKQ